MTTTEYFADYVLVNGSYSSLLYVFGLLVCDILLVVCGWSNQLFYFSASKCIVFFLIVLIAKPIQ